MFNAEHCIYQVVLGGTLPDHAAGLLSLYKPLPTAVLATTADGEDKPCRVMCDVMQGTLGQIQLMFANKLDMAVRYMLDQINSDTRRSVQFGALQDALRHGKQDACFTGGSTIFDRLEEKVLLGLPNAMQTVNGKQRLLATPAAARELAAQLVAWADTAEAKGGA